MKFKLYEAYAVALCVAVGPFATAQGGTLPIPDCPGMKTTDSGLQYGVLRVGDKTPGPGPEDVVEVHYRSWLADGTLIESTRDRGIPTTFTSRQVIKGLAEGLRLMTTGSRFKLVIPPELAYGIGGRPPRIPGNQSVVYDIELLSVIPIPKMPPTLASAPQSASKGVSWQVLQAGAGTPAADHDGLVLRYAIWKQDGTFLDSSERQQMRRLRGTLATLPFPFLGEIVRPPQVGLAVRAEVPRQLCPEFGNDTVWKVEVADISRVPGFRACDPARSYQTPEGLTHEVLVPGTGPSPARNDSVVLHYTGWLADGTLLDSSHSRGIACEIPLRYALRPPSSPADAGTLRPGTWCHALERLQAGGKSLFRIPSRLAYGEEGVPPRVPPNTDLIFLFELIEVRPAAGSSGK